MIRIMIRLLLATIIIWLAVASLAAADMVRVTVSKANIRTDPGSEHRIIATGREGDLFPIIDSGDKWWKVRLPNGKEGWIYKKAVRYEKETYRTKIRPMAETVLGPYLKWATLNEVYLEEYRIARLDIMITPRWLQLDEETRKDKMIRTAKAFAQLCEEEDLLKEHTKEEPYVVFYNRYNTIVGKANKENAVLIHAP
jgi:uncharacterized protein YgiM (DUF1202 family)